MNFFEHQERARKNTTRLVALFGLAVVLLSAALYLALRVAQRYAECPEGEVCHLPWFNARLFFTVVGVTLGFILMASTLKILSLREGGGKVATLLGGVPVDPATRDVKVRRYINVVEEMALASGVPTPAIYVLPDEPGINAFAAGWSPSNAAVAVTRGCLDTLTRDELQGVIAHEFSHVLNGDMRLNIKVMGVVFGLLALGETGRIIVNIVGRAGFASSGSRRSSSDKKGGGGAVLLAILAAGVVIMVIGYVGTAIGRIIQAALSRQREFLADASAVQFTRNPSGISGALKKIGGLKQGSRLKSPKVGQVGHLLFGQGMTSWLGAVMATHPPLVERIRRIEPGFQPDELGKAVVEAPEPEAELRFAPSVPAAAASGFSAPVAAQPAAVLGSVGQLDEAGIRAGAALRSAIPEDLYVRVQEADGASDLVLALLLGVDPDERRSQVKALVAALGQERSGGIVQLSRRLQSVDHRLRLPLIDLATPALRRLDGAAREQLLTLARQLATADGQVTLFEAGLWWLLRRRLVDNGRRAGRTRSMAAVGPDLARLLDLLAQVGGGDDRAAATRAFRTGLGRLGGAWPQARAIGDDALGSATLADLEPLLDRLADVSYAVKNVALDATAHVVMSDGKVTVDEAELLRLVAFALDVPLPPFLEAQAVAGVPLPA